MKQKKIYSPVWALILGMGMIGGACSSDELAGRGQEEVRLQPHFYAGTPETRSIVNGTSSAGGADKINTVALYVTRKDNHVAYPGVTASGKQDGYSLFTKQSDDTWTGAPEVKLANIVARMYAYSPSDGTVTPATNADTHTIPISIPADQTFAGGTSGSEGNGWECSGTDYLYGTTSQEIGTVGDITASNTSYKPSVYLHHALAQVVFKLQTVSGRPVDNTYDFVKKITLTATGDYFRTGTSGTMLLKDGTLGSLTAGKALTFKPSVAASAIKCGDGANPKVVAYGLVAPMTTAPAASSINLTILLGKPAAEDGERELTVTIPTPVQWTKGKRYIYTLNLSNRAVTVDATTTITDWTPQEDSGDMKPDGF